MSKDQAKIKKDGTNLKEEIRGRTVGYLVASLGLVAGLAWNEAVAAIIQYIFPLGKNTIWAKLIYAIVITLVVVIVSIYLNRILRSGQSGD